MAEPYLSQDSLLLIKAESTYGTDPTPAAADDAVHAYDVAVSPVAATVSDRNVLTGRRGARGRRVAEARRTVAFGVELAGAGGAGDVPAWGAIAKACGLSETITAETDVVYAPASAGHGSLAALFYSDGDAAKVLGLRGNATLRFTPNAEPMLMVEGVGLHSPLTSTALPTTQDFSTHRPGLQVNAANTTLTLDGTALAVSSFEMRTGWTLTYADRPGVHEVRLTERTVGGSIEFERPRVAVKDFAAKFLAEAPMVLALVHGGDAGDIIGIDIPALQLSSEPRITTREGIEFMSFDFVCPPVDGDDEFTLTVE